MPKTNQKYNKPSIQWIQTISLFFSWWKSDNDGPQLRAMDYLFIYLRKKFRILIRNQFRRFGHLIPKPSNCYDCDRNHDRFLCKNPQWKIRIFFQISIMRKKPHGQLIRAGILTMNDQPIFYDCKHRPWILHDRRLIHPFGWSVFHHCRFSRLPI